MRQVITQRSKIAWKSEKGMTLVEVMIAITLIGLVAASILMSYNLAYRFARINTNRTIAIQFAQAAMDEEKRQGFAGWTFPDTNPYLVPGATGNMTTTITGAPVAAGVRRVVVTVSWTDRDIIKSEVLRTLLAQ